MRTRTKAIKAMNKCAPQTKGKNFDYPDQTKGSQAAAEIRKETNGLGEHKREDLFRRGMQIIYGGSGKKESVRTGH
jgi:hypothetical protein